MAQLVINIPPEQCPPPYGHIHHGDMLRFFEEGRRALYAECGIILEDQIKAGYLPVVTAVKVDYVREVVPGSWIVESTVRLGSAKRLEFRQYLRSSTGSIAARAVVTVGILRRDYSSGSLDVLGTPFGRVVGESLT
jgi:acyl-CoA thioesterase FadM